MIIIWIDLLFTTIHCHLSCNDMRVIIVLYMLINIYDGAVRKLTDAKLNYRLIRNDAG